MCQPQPQEPPQQPPPVDGASASAVPVADPGRREATWLISGMLERLSQRGHSADSSRSPIERSTSNVARQSLQRYS